MCVPGASSPAEMSDSDDEMGEYVGAVISELTSDNLRIGIRIRASINI